MKVWLNRPGEASPQLVHILRVLKGQKMAKVRAVAGIYVFTVPTNMLVWKGHA